MTYSHRGEHERVARGRDGDGVEEHLCDLVALSQRQIAEKLGLHRNTVKKYIESNTLPTYSKSIRKSTILDSFRQLIDDYLAEDACQATWIFDRLQKSGYQASVAVGAGL